MPQIMDIHFEGKCVNSLFGKIFESDYFIGI